MVVVWHVCSITKLKRYEQQGHIIPPVRAWLSINAAEKFSKQTGRQMILRLKFPQSKMKKLTGHKGNAVFVDYPVDFKEMFGGTKNYVGFA